MPKEMWSVMGAPGFMSRWRSGISQPIGYCTNKSATISQWNTFAVVPYCKRSVMRLCPWLELRV